jgi:hypothetical protein
LTYFQPFWSGGEWMWLDVAGHRRRVVGGGVDVKCCRLDYRDVFSSSQLEGSAISLVVNSNAFPVGTNAEHHCLLQYQDMIANHKYSNVQYTRVCVCVCVCVCVYIYIYIYTMYICI